MKSKRILNILFLLPFIFSCGVKAYTSDKLYSEYESNYLDNIENMYKKDGKYLIYFYFESCKYCTSIKGNVFDYIDLTNNDTENKYLPIYIFNMYSSKTSEGALNRSYFKDKGESYDSDLLIAYMNNKNNVITAIEDTYFIANPSLYVIDNGVLDYVRVGTNDVINELYDLSH